MWISNPLASALFVPATSVVVLVLGGSLTVIFVSAQLRLADLGRNTLFVRWRTWAVIAPVYGLAVLGGTAPTAVLVAGLSLQGLREYSRLVGLPGPFRRVLIALGLLPGAVALIVPNHFLALPVLLLLAA
ncbi:MAG TPA: hypothetical protein VHL09_00365, partial [Dehalococcoidia bacterium]|nr:hypothetical protein [Dehalococcoidia bacterium]